MKTFWSVVLCVVGGFAAAQPAPLSEYLSSGRLADGELALSARLETRTGDQQTRFSLGVVQFLRAVEGLAQAGYRYGVRAEQGQAYGLPLLRLPVPPNPNPEEIGYDDLRELLKTFVTDLEKTERTLAGVTSPDVKVRIPFGLIRLDLDGNDTATDAERFWTIYTRYNALAPDLEPEALPVVFDLGDARWLQGYTHLLMALTQTYLAYDGRDLFEHTAQLFYPRVRTPHTLLKNTGPTALGFDGAEIADLVAFVHLLNLPVAEPDRLRRALTHFEAVAEQSRASWRAIRAENDNDLEWLPNPRQQSVVPVRVSAAQIDAWLRMLDEAEAIFAGEKLVPHWRVQGRGIDLRRVFLEPRRFDLILWLQGGAATPYLERGEVTRGETWAQIRSVFGGNFFGFAFWFN